MEIIQQGRFSGPYYNGIMKLVFGVYAKNKDLIKEMIKEGSSIISICFAAYNLLVYDKVIQPCDSTDKTQQCLYLIEVV